MNETEKIIYASAHATVEVLKNPRLGLDTCILGTRVLIETAACHGVTMKPQPTMSMAWNRAGWDLRNAGVPISEWPNDAWTIGVDPRAPLPTRGYPAHLVARCGDLLIDTTAVQMNRPAHNLHVPREPLYVGIPADWSEEYPAIWGNSDDDTWQTAIMYYRANVPSFRSSPWWRSGEYKPYISRAIHLSRELLGADRAKSLALSV